MPECAKIDKVLNMHMILNMPKFWIWQGSQYMSFTQPFDFARMSCLTEFWMYLEFKICQYSEYETVTQGSKYTPTWLNTSELDENMPEDVSIYNNKEASEYVSYNT